MTHIILLDGKFWAFEPPEKPYQNRKEGIPTISKSWEHYNRAYSLALEQKVEVDNPGVAIAEHNGSLRLVDHGSRFFKFKVGVIKENEPIKWDGTVEIVTQRLNKLDGSQGASRKVCRLIAPVKEEPTHGQKMKAVRKRADWLKYCLDIGWTKDQLPGLEKIWDDNHDEFGNLIKSPVPSEQENLASNAFDQLWDMLEKIRKDGYIISDHNKSILEEILTRK